MAEQDEAAADRERLQAARDRAGISRNSNEPERLQVDEIRVPSSIDFEAAAERRRIYEEERKRKDVAERFGRISGGFAECGLPEEYAEAQKTLATYKADNPSLGEALSRVQQWVDRAEPIWLFIWSKETGLGKTHLAAAALAEVIRRGSRGRFVAVADLVTRARDVDMTRTEIERYSKTPVLVLDDLGAEKPTEFSVSVISQILNARYAGRRPTIITSNFDLQSIGLRLAIPGEEPHARQVASRRIVDRIFEHTGGREGSGDIELRGESFRRK